VVFAHQTRDLLFVEHHAIGISQSRRQRVDCDAARTKFFGQAVGKLLDGRFAPA
jgi:hypothetical protein